MFLFPKYLIALLKANSLEIYTVKGKVFTLAIPQTILSYQEIRDKEAFVTLVKNFFAENKLERKDILFLVTQELIYEKELEAGNESSSFLSSLPFHEVLNIRLSHNDKDIVMATPKEVIELFIKAIDEVGGKVVGVVPSRFYNIVDSPLQVVQLQAVYKNKQPIKEANFLAHPSLSQSKNTKKSSNVSTIAITIICFIFICALFAGGIFFVQSMQSKAAKPAQEENITPTPQESVQPTQEAPNKEALTLRILNGSGTAGLASKVASLLKEKEYTNITTGNAPKTTDTTEVILKSDVDKMLQDEIIALLEEQFATVTKTATDAASVDIQITLGKEK